ncbi:MAG: sigma 54-interacting transcriptional regulator [Pseudomonadota bacterium]
MSMPHPKTLGELRTSEWRSRPIRDEMRENLMAALGAQRDVFPGIVGYDETVIPQLQNALLAGQDIILLGERGQAKTRLIRCLTALLDEWTPTLANCDIPEDPFAPISASARAQVSEHGDDAPIEWIHRDDRYGEKLATPDITIADLIGEVDPVKIAEGRYLSDELTLSYGLLPRSNRGIFAINELPDLAERIQVGLLNVMQERDVQIRGHKVRMPLDILIVATANPEDYTNRGRIITPLKDRYGAQIRTHYPRDVEEEINIMTAESATFNATGREVEIPDFIPEIIANITRHARNSPDISQRSGVSVRATISNFETVMANALRRALRTDESTVVPRITDLPFLLASLGGKLEFETFEEGRESEIMLGLIAKAVADAFQRRVDLEGLEHVVYGFREGVELEVGEDIPARDYGALFEAVSGLRDAVDRLAPNASDGMRAAYLELMLDGLHQQQLLNKDVVEGRTTYRG